jgi:hypothetical protein
MVTYQISDNLFLRLYNNTEPNNGKIAELHKGAVLLHGREEVIGEGLGFGGIVVNYAGATYFSKNAELVFNDSTAEKIFHMDSLEVGEPFNTTFVNTKAIGSAKVTYTIGDGILHIKVDLSDLPSNSTIIVLNEQSGMRFSRYIDESGNTTEVNFSWKQVFSKENYLVDENNKGFGIELTGEIRDSAKLYLGREVEPEGFDWAGLDLEIDAAVMDVNEFEYDVRFME